MTLASKVKRDLRSFSIFEVSEEHWREPRDLITRVLELIESVSINPLGALSFNHMHHSSNEWGIIQKGSRSQRILGMG